MEQLRWLPERPDFRARLKTLAAGSGDFWADAVALANSRLDFVRTNALDGVV